MSKTYIHKITTKVPENSILNSWTDNQITQLIREVLEAAYWDDAEVLKVKQVGFALKDGD